MIRAKKTTKIVMLKIHNPIVLDNSMGLIKLPHWKHALSLVVSRCYHKQSLEPRLVN